MNTSSGLIINRPNTTLFLGCMFSGKTSALIETVHRHVISGRNCIIIRRDFDTRNPDLTTVNTHFGTIYKKCPVKITKKIMDIDDLDIYDVIAIDEGQFFDSNDLRDFVKSYHDKYIIISALNGSWDLKPFDAISTIIPYCENIIKLDAICEICKERADFSKKVLVDVDNNIVKKKAKLNSSSMGDNDDNNSTNVNKNVNNAYKNDVPINKINEQIIIGGKDAFIPTCYRCLISN